MRALGPLRKPVSQRDEIQDPAAKSSSHLRIAKT
jgi:hypothetical protein